MAVKLVTTGADLRGVIVGAGFFAAFQAEAWRRIPGVRIVAVADIDRARAQAFADQWEIPTAYGDAGDMLAGERPDFVDIVTRPESHLALATLAAEHGAHVICQKPLAPSWDLSVAVVSVCAARGVRCLVHENWRFQPWYRACRRLIDENMLGRIFYLGFCMRTGDGRGPAPYAAQPYFREMQRFLVYETGVHFLDTARYLAGNIDSVYCRTRRLNSGIRGEDFAIIQVAFAGGVEGLIDANRIAGPVPSDLAMATLRIDGDRGTLRTTGDGRLWLTEYGEPERPYIYDIPMQGYRCDSVKATQEHLAAALRSGARAETEGHDYLATVAAMFACYESADTGLPVVPRKPPRIAA